MTSDKQRAQEPAQVLPQAGVWAGKTVVIKYGGSAMEDERKKREVIDDVALLHKGGARVVLVHGGGREINAMLQRVGITPRFIDGLRYTDGQTMSIVQQVLCGGVNKRLCALLAQKNITALGLCGLDGALIRARPTKDERLGLVGEVTSVNALLLKELTARGVLPVIATVALADDGGSLNINADTAAAAIAVAVGAQRLLLLTDVPGVLRDKNDPATLIPTIRAKEVEGLRADGVITGGMLPKIDCCVDAVRGGVDSAAIVDGLAEHAILAHLCSAVSAGTAIVR